MTALASSRAGRNSPALDLAARLVSDLYDAIQRPDLSGMIRGSNAEDFPEVGAAAAALSEYSAKIQRYEDALHQYADADFWDDSMPGGALAEHDQGVMARNVLAGRPAFFHRD